MFPKSFYFFKNPKVLSRIFPRCSQSACRDFFWNSNGRKKDLFENVILQGFLLIQWNCGINQKLKKKSLDLLEEVLRNTFFDLKKALRKCLEQFIPPLVLEFPLRVFSVISKRKSTRIYQQPTLKIAAVILRKHPQKFLRKFAREFPRISVGFFKEFPQKFHNEDFFFK